MSKTRFFQSVTVEQAKWLEASRIRKGKNTVQDVVRDLISEAYEKSKVK